MIASWYTADYMKYDKYGVLKVKGKEPETFWVLFFDSSMSNPFMQTSGDLDEKGVRDWATNAGLSKEKADELLARARANPK